MLIQDNTVLEGKLPHFGGKTTLPPKCEECRSIAGRSGSVLYPPRPAARLVEGMVEGHLRRDPGGGAEEVPPT